MGRRPDTVQEILSRSNRIIKDYIKLAENRRYRAETGRFVIEGRRLLDDALKSGANFDYIILSGETAARSPELAARLPAGCGQYLAAGQVAEKLASTKNTQGVFAAVFMPGKLDNGNLLDRINISGKYIALEDIQDPGNLGTILRSLEAFGLDGALLSPGCADLYSPKTVRASMGAVFRCRAFLTDDLPGTIRQLRERGMRAFAAVADVDAKDVTGAGLGTGCVVAVGNEGNGLTAGCEDACGERVTIRMDGRAQSLNAASAASILMWEMVRGRSAR